MLVRKSTFIIENEFWVARGLYSGLKILGVTLAT